VSFDSGMFSLAATGNLEDFIDQEIEVIERGAMDAAYKMEARGKGLLRADVRKGGLGPKLANTWRARTFPDRAKSMTPKVRFSNNAQLIINAFQHGERIKSAKGFDLPIPTDDFLSSISDRQRSQNRKNLIRLAEQKFGKLRFVPVPGERFSLLVADSLQRSRGRRGGFRVASESAKRRRKTESVVLFILVPEARLKKRLNYEAIERDLERDWFDVMAQEISASLNNGGPA